MEHSRAGMLKIIPGIGDSMLTDCTARHARFEDMLRIVDRADRRFRVLAIKLVKHGTLKTYPGLPHGMASTHPEVINADLLEFLRS
jgi:hypothetical protein